MEVYVNGKPREVEGDVPLAALLDELGVDRTSTTTITLRSGNGIIGSSDSKITMLAAPIGAPFSTAFTSADFAAARSGPGAMITATRSGDWKAALDSDPISQWVFDGRDGTALYAIDFILTASMLSAVSLGFEFLIDNQLGDTYNEGLFVNELPLVGSKRLGAVVARFQVDQSLPTRSAAAACVFRNHLSRLRTHEQPARHIDHGQSVATR